MIENLHSMCNSKQLRTITSIVQIGDSVYNELTSKNTYIFDHKYMLGEKKRMYTKLVHMQCEMESKSPDFPFEFRERNLPFGQKIPELYMDNCIMHFAPSQSTDILPSYAEYKKELSERNRAIRRQLIFNELEDKRVIVKNEAYYSLIAFGKKNGNLFIALQFPEPEYTGIAHSFIIPQLILSGDGDHENFKRKQAELKEKYLFEMKKEGEDK